jgi:hypothetical protein
MWCQNILSSKRHIEDNFSPAVGVSHKNRLSKCIFVTQKFQGGGSEKKPQKF